MMKYAQMLDSMISKSNLSLRQLSSKCTELGCQITPSYICQLKNGKLPAPSEEVTEVIATVCGEKNYKKLIFEGYFEKLPHTIKEYISISTELNKALFKRLFNKGTHEVDIPHDILEYLDELDCLNTLELSIKYAGLYDMSEGSLPIEELSDEINMLTGCIQTNKSSEPTNFFIRDTSMEPTIPSNALVTIIPTKKELLKNKDIVAFHEGLKTIIVRRFFQEKGKIFLIPDNREHEIFFFENDEDFKYAGKIISYKVNM